MSVGKSEPERIQKLDASALKAYTHPLRLRMLRYMENHGAATATQLAEHLGESTGQTSYHLRQLAKHGLIQDDPARGTGRERWWKPVSIEVDATRLREDPDFASAAQALMASVVEGRADTLRRWVAAVNDAPEDWMRRSLHSQSTLTLTQDEFEELNEKFQQLLGPYAERSRERDATDLPEDTQRIRVYYDAFPLLAEE